MNGTIRTVAFWAWGLSLLNVAAAGAQPVTTQSLIREMIDLERLATFPEPAYRTVQFSSYDRRSRYPSAPGWFANSDGFGKEPIPGFEKVLREPDENGIGTYLICDVEGPGAVVRLWTAAIEGQVRVYLDGSKEPLYEGPAEPFFMKAYQPIGAAESPRFEGSYSQSFAGYYPIPFAGGFRMEWVGDLNTVHFYHVQLRLYEAGREVRTFAREDLTRYADDIREVGAVLAEPQKRWSYTSSSTPIEIVETISAGETRAVFALDGPRALERLTLKIHAADMEKALRQTLLNITFDDAPYGQVQAPLGDFFGAAPGINPFDSVPFTVLADGTMVCRFWMPFKDSALITIENRGRQAVTVTGTVLPADYTWEKGKSMHFRARWRVDHDLAASGEHPQDIPYLLARGKGSFVGAAAFVMNPTSVPSSWGNWWGEGDEKIYVDDDDVPSTFGTGSEDYFNYAWSSSDIFSYAYCGQPRNDGPANRGFVTNHRWQVLDNLPFRNRFDFYMELFSHEPVPGFSYARLAYHYGVPEMTDDHMLITDEDVRHLRLPEKWMPIGRKFTEKAIFYQAEELLDADHPVNLVEGDMWAGGKLMVWQPHGSDDPMTLNLPIPDDGKYIIVLTAGRSPRAGSFSARVGEVPLTFGEDSKVVELRAPYRILSRNYRSREIELTRGVHPLVVQSEDGGGGEIGLDFIWVLPR